MLVTKLLLSYMADIKKFMSDIEASGRIVGPRGKAHPKVLKSNHHSMHCQTFENFPEQVTHWGGEPDDLTNSMLPPIMRSISRSVMKKKKQTDVMKKPGVAPPIDGTPKNKGVMKKPSSIGTPDNVKTPIVVDPKVAKKVAKKVVAPIVATPKKKKAKAPVVETPKGKTVMKRPASALGKKPAKKDCSAKKCHT